MVGARYRVTQAIKTPSGDLSVSLVDDENAAEGQISIVIDGDDDRDVADFEVGNKFEVTLDRIK